MSYFVTGAAGFIGSSLVDRLLARGESVIGFDNLSTGRREFLQNASRNAKFQLVEGDLLDIETLTEAMRGARFVFHLCSNADVRCGKERLLQDLEQNTVATFNVLEPMAAIDNRRIEFSSSEAIYG